MSLVNRDLERDEEKVRILLLCSAMLSCDSSLPGFIPTYLLEERSGIIVTVLGYRFTVIIPSRQEGKNTVRKAISPPHTVTVFPSLVPGNL